MADIAISTEQDARKRSFEEMEASNRVVDQPNPHDRKNDCFSPSVSAPSIDYQENPLMSSVAKERQMSPESTLTSISLNTVAGPPAASNLPAPPPAKRRKLTPQERAEREEQKRKDAEAKEERRQQREHNRQVKAEEIRKKNEEREEKKRLRDLEKQQKEHIVQERRRQGELLLKQKQEAIQKKQRAQSLLTTFFATSPLKLKTSLTNTTRERSMSIASVDSAIASPTKLHPGTVTAEAEPQPQFAQYKKVFLPYSIPANTILPLKDPEILDAIESADLDSFMQQSDTSPPPLKSYAAPYKAMRGLLQKPLKELVAGMNSSKDSELLLERIRGVSIKYLYFDEDVRPPYCGTWTKELSEENAHSVARNPCARLIQEINYDYDSEAEWTEPEEGEDVDSDGEDDAEVDGIGDDMEGFLDNEDDSPNKSLIPKEEVVWSGVLFEDAAGVPQVPSAANLCEDLMSYQMGSLIPEQMGAAGHTVTKPYSMAYWGGPDSPFTATSKKVSFFLPLGAQSDSLVTKSKPTFTSLRPIKAKPQPKTAKDLATKMIAGKDLEVLKQAIVGRTETKAELIPYLQKRFTKWSYTKTALGNAISAVATRHGQLKTWILVHMPNEVLDSICTS